MAKCLPGLHHSLYDLWSVCELCFRVCLFSTLELIVAVIGLDDRNFFSLHWVILKVRYNMAEITRASLFLFDIFSLLLLLFFAPFDRRTI